MFKSVQPRKIADVVAGKIRDAIVGGDYVPGDKLPAERDLAGQFGINRASVREALHRLETWGLVVIRHGAGVRVADFLSTASLNLLPFLLAPGGRLDLKLLTDVLTLRTELLGWTAAQAATQAATQADDETLETLCSILAALDATPNIEQTQTLDYDFFEQLVAMTGNTVLGFLANQIRAVYRENHTLFQALYLEGLDTRYHHQTIEALRAGDAPAARRAMTEYGQTALASLPEVP